MAPVLFVYDPEWMPLQTTTMTKTKKKVETEKIKLMMSIKDQEPDFLLYYHKEPYYSPEHTSHTDELHSPIPLLGQIYNKCYIQHSK